MDEKQLQFLYGEYAKNKGFKDYSEFKGLMSSEDSRKMFFEDANKELGFKDYNEFNDLLGLKKKDGTIVSGPIPSKLPLQDYLSQGEKMAQVGYTIPKPSLQGREKIRVSPKLFGAPGQVEVEVGADQEDGTYKNIAQRFTNDLLKGGAEIGASAAEAFRDMGAKQKAGIAKISGVERIAKEAKEAAQPLYTKEGLPTEYAKSVTWASDPTAKTILGLNGVKDNAVEFQQYTKLPEGAIGETVESISSFTPDILFAGLVPEAKLAEGAALIPRIGSKLINSFTKYLMVKDPLVAYGKAKQEGATSLEAAGKVPMAALKGTVTGAALGAAGWASEAMTKGIMGTASKYLLGSASNPASNGILQKASEIGLTGKGGMVTKELVNTLTDVISYSLLYPTASSLMERGELPTAQEIKSGIGPAIAFRIKGAFDNAKTFGDLNNAINEIQATKQGAAFVNFMEATPESILKVHGSKESANDLQLQALEAAQRARKEIDPQEKQKAVIQASTLSKASNVKQMTDYIISNKDGFKDFLESDAPEEAKAAFIEKATAINKAANPIEQQKTAVGDRIIQANDFIKQSEAAINVEPDPVKKAELQFQVDQANKVLKQQEADLNKLISDQNAPRDLDLNNVKNIKENRKLDEKEINDAIDNLDVNDPDYSERVESLNRQKDEQNDYYDDLIKKTEEADKIDKSGVITPEEFDLVQQTDIPEITSTEVAEEVKPTELEAKKADIIKRRNKELADVPNLSLDMNKEENDKLISKTNEIYDKYDAELKALEEVKPTEVKELGKKSVEELEKRQAEIEDAKTGTPEREEFNKIDKELEEREWRSVFDAPIEKVSDVVDAIMKKEKEMPNGFGSYMEPRDARLTKDVANRYSKENASRLTIAEVIKDFKDAMFGSPMDSYADGLKLKEAIHQARERGINLFEELSKEFVKDGYTKQDAIDMAKIKLEPFLKSIELAKEVKPTEVKEEPKKTYKEVLKEKQEAEKKLNREIGAEKAIVTKEIFRKVAKMDAPENAEQIALRYLADGGKISEEAVNEAYGSVKGAELNIPRRKKISEEVKLRDYVSGNETLKSLAHKLWEISGQKISERDIRDKLMTEIGNNTTRFDAAEAYLDRYSAEYQDEKNMMRIAEENETQFLEEQKELERQLRSPLEEQIEGEASETHINNLIEQYESEIKTEDQQLRSEGEGKAIEEVSGRAGAEEAAKETLAEAYKDLARIEKRKIINSKFEELVKELKIEKICP